MSSCITEYGEFVIRNDFSPEKWDAALAKLRGHPLQSALWGGARRTCDGILDERWAISCNDQVIGLIRIEHRGRGLFKRFLAWAPQGPIIEKNFDHHDLLHLLTKQQNLAPFSLLVTCPWGKSLTTNQKSVRRTIWINLQLGKERLWSNFDKQWRYGVRRAEKFQVAVEITKDKLNVTAFFNLCQQVSDTKNFKLRGSPDFLYYLLHNSLAPDVDGQLFIAKYQNNICAGAFILRVGKTIHYMWGAVDRKYNRERVGEFIQWQIIDWACTQGYELYDLEGIDEVTNPGVASFKKKMGGNVIEMQGINKYPLNWRGSLVARFIKD